MLYLRLDVFDYIEIFYNPKRRHRASNRLSPVEYEEQYFERRTSTEVSRGDSLSKVEASSKPRAIQHLTHFYCGGPHINN